MRTLLGVVLFTVAGALCLLELAALADPAGTALANDASPFGPAPAWYVHAAWLVVVVALFIAAIRLLNRGILGRLVRGRGFTPAAR
jgi:hypothetical protein